jgi:hypothetical protein
MGVSEAGMIVDDGVIEVIAGPGLSTTNESALDVPPPGAGFVTESESVAAAFRLAAGMLAVRDVALTYVVVKGVVPRLRVDAGTNPLPVTVIGVAPAPIRADDGETDVATGAGSETVNARGLVVPPPGAGFFTAT